MARVDRALQLSQIEAFLEVARLGSVHRAAEAVFLSQPALTARVSALESALGAKLFERLPHGMTLTPAGQAFLSFAERAIETLAEGAALVGEVEHGLAGEIHVGAMPGVGTYVLPEVIARFAEQRPNVRLKVRTGHTDDIVEMIVRREIDIGIARATTDRRVVTRPLYDDELILVAAAGRDPVTHDVSGLEAFQTARLILSDAMSAYPDMTQSLLEQAGLCGEVMELDNIATAKRMVERGLGIGLLPATTVADALAAGTLRALPLPGSEAIRRPMVLVLPRNQSREHPTVTALAELLGHVPDLIPGARRVA